jgi:threonine dehydratase
MWHWNLEYEIPIEKKFQTTVEVGYTEMIPAPESIQKLCKAKLLLKREDLSETGSFKFRGISYQLALAAQNKQKAVIVPTSGNAGIAAAVVAKKIGMKAYVFSHPNIDSIKLKVLKEAGANVFISSDSLRQANIFSLRENIPNLRSSTDPMAIEGYKSLGAEICEQARDANAVFTYVTSGSSLLGMGKYFEKYYKNIQLHAVQSVKIHSIVSEFQKIDSTEHQKAGHGGIRETRRKESILETIRASHGSGWFITNEEIETIKKLLSDENIFTSFESCASLAAAIKASSANSWKKIVIIFSGCDWGKRATPKN